MNLDSSPILLIPWCATLLDDPDIVITPTISREPKHSTEDALFAETLKTDSTISACLTFHPRPSPPTALISQISTLVTLEQGVNGYPHMAHGGLVGFLFDEIMGLVLSMNKSRGAIFNQIIVTAELTVKYLKPVATPQTVLVTVWLKEIVGRKIGLQATMKDSKGTELAKADGLWIAVSKDKGKL
ncbi:HotDog domain-containing protein [Tricladium varicosporioides]|nr:HotDog domain-containing protein [Hymenoscyphus varicosporioides]